MTEGMEAGGAPLFVARLHKQGGLGRQPRVRKRLCARLGICLGKHPPGEVADLHARLARVSPMFDQDLTSYLTHIRP